MATTATSADVNEWTAVLDALEARLVTQEAAVARVERGEPFDAAELVAFVPPATLPPLPGALAARATELLARIHRGQDGVANLLDTARPARALRRRPHTAPSATRLDVRA